MPIHSEFLDDFVSVQRHSFFELLENGIREEFTKRNPIMSFKKDFSFFFYPDYYILTRPKYNPHDALFQKKSYTSQLFVPVQITSKKKKKIILKWMYIGNIPLMTKRGHFILNGAPRVIINQVLRSPGVYYQEKSSENDTFSDSSPHTSSSPQSLTSKEDDYSTASESEDEEIQTGHSFSSSSSSSEMGYSEKTLKRFYCDFICLRGSWLRIEMDKKKAIWAQLKKGPKIPIYWFLLAMGLSEKVILKSIIDSSKLFLNLDKKRYSPTPEKTETKTKYEILKYPPEAWKAIYMLIHTKRGTNQNEKSSQTTPSLSSSSLSSAEAEAEFKTNEEEDNEDTFSSSSDSDSNHFKEKAILPAEDSFSSPLLSLPELPNHESADAEFETDSSQKVKSKSFPAFKPIQNYSLLGRQWFYNRFLNPRHYDLGKQGRLALNQKLGLNIASHHSTLTALDVLYATDYLLKVDKGIYKTDDIDHLKNRRIRTSGELIQIQIGVGLLRLEKLIRYSVHENIFTEKKEASLPSPLPFPNPKVFQKATDSVSAAANSCLGRIGKWGEKKGDSLSASDSKAKTFRDNFVFTSSTPFHKAFNSAIQDFFGTSPLSQFMDQMNPLAELTHKRRLSSMGPGGITRESATLALRGIHPTHYGRICPIETPEGKNTGLVNSMTAYARVSISGLLESPFYKVYKGQVQKNEGLSYFTAEQEEKRNVAAADLYVSPLGFLPKSLIPVRIAKTFTKRKRTAVHSIGISPLQMISIATSLIPFLEHDDANRALMGSNMQRQAVPVIRPERPIVGTGLEARTIRDSGHIIQSQFSGLVTYVSAQKIKVFHAAEEE